MVQSFLSSDVTEHEARVARFAGGRDELILTEDRLIHERTARGEAEPLRRTAPLDQIQSCYLKDRRQAAWLVVAGIGAFILAVFGTTGRWGIAAAGALIAGLGLGIWHQTGGYTLHVIGPGVRIKVREQGSGRRALRRLYRRINQQISAVQ